MHCAYPYGMPETTTALPFTNEDYALGYTDYIVMTRSTPDAQWSSAFAFPAPSCTLDTAEGHLAYFQRLHEQFVAEATEKVAKAKTGEKRAKRQANLDALKQAEYRIFSRQVSPFAPHPA